VGVFPGSFNPVHIGHLALANWFCEYGGMDEVWFLVTPQNPLKEDCRMTDFRLRMEWVEKSVAGYPKFRVSDVEDSLPRPSYTVATLRTLRRVHHGCLFHLIVGADNWAILDQWKDSRALLEEFPVRIYPRKGFDTVIPPHLSQASRVNAPLMEISSSFVRQGVKEGKDVRFFVPETLRKDINLLKKFL
jgi:nicotinate-nucleotide adenylyltransferase